MAGLSKKNRALFRKIAAAADAGDKKRCATDFYECLECEPSSEEQPVRPLANGEVVIIRSKMSGPAHDPDYDELFIHIKRTDHYVILLIFNEGIRGWHPDFDTARLADKDGKEIKGKAGKLPPEDKAILENVFSRKPPASAPEHKIG